MHNIVANMQVKVSIIPPPVQKIPHHFRLTSPFPLPFPQFPVTPARRCECALYLSAFASLKADPTSRIYYDKKIAEGKRHKQAIISLAHKRTTVLYAMPRDRTPYPQHKPQQLKKAT